MEPALLLAVVVAAVCAVPVVVGLPGAALRRVPGVGVVLPRSAGLASITALVLALRAGPAPAAPPPPGERLVAVEPGRPAPGIDPAHPTYRVVPGDTLWGIACRRLVAVTGRVPDDARINRYWRQIYAVNRHVVGADPDLIFPGQQFVIPPEV